MNPSSVLGGAESTDELMKPPSVVRSERNQLMEPLQSTDGKMYPALVELMETSERFLSSGKARPLVVTELEAVEDNSKLVSNNSEATITVVPVKHATTRAVVYPNFSSGHPIIIIKEDDGGKYPVMKSDMAGEPECLERGDQDTTAATVVAGAEQKIQTKRFSDSCEDSMTSTPAVGGTAPTDEVTSQNCGYFGEAVEPTVDTGLDETHTSDEGGMPLNGWVATALGADDCCDTTEECSTELQHGSAPRPGTRISLKPTVVAGNVKYEKNENGLPSGSMVVGGRDEASQGSITPKPLSLSEHFSEIQKDNEIEEYENEIKKTEKFEVEEEKD